MPETLDLPVAVRATAYTGSSKWLRRPSRFVRYDACWADGRVEFGVSLTQAMYRGHPADFAAIDESVHSHCPEVGTGLWVDDSGQVAEGPDQPGPSGSGGRPRKYGFSRSESSAKWSYGFQLGGGVLGVGLGALLIMGPLNVWWAGPLGVVCFLSGLAALTGLVMRKN
ncbi:hypothetical protein [Arthrobacter sp. ISL-95]|uniref:hypothetical protein n=1 Tax=Arthrobacter sp. ISL-95 TaxID=2819116 RepID=UPI001BEA9BD8|nr:hypothetical protein [Arthrobacter sp. ISL-95]MBT2585585.1 hypothetical protein [Arthrobacter sp. ISL-95]